MFVPLNDNGKHWYLLVFDFENEEIVYLDSFPEEDRLEYRIFNAKLVVRHK